MAKILDSPSRNKSYIQPIPCKNKEIYTQLNTLIVEYLEVNGLVQALQTFTKECQSKNLPCPKQEAGGVRDLKAAFTHYDGELLLKSFDEGDLDNFLALWKLFMTHIQVTSQDMRKLEVYLRVHFAVWPKANRLPEVAQSQAMHSLKTYFEENSATLSSDSTILPLFALPYVPDPRPHPIFKDLFQDSWTMKLRAQLETTVNKYFELLQENITTHCKLASVIARGSKLSGVSHHYSQSAPGVSSAKSPASSGVKATSNPKSPGAKSGANTAEVVSLIKMSESVVNYHQNRFFQLIGIHKRTRKTLRSTRESYGKLLGVCKELITALEKVTNQEGESQDSSQSFEQILQQCFLIHPEIFTNPESLGNPGGSKKPDLAYFKSLALAPPIEQPLDSDVSLIFLGLADIGPYTLNYSKIKDTLLSDTVLLTDKLSIWQALRWMITKTSLEARTQVMDAFARSDILGLAADKSELRNKLYSCLLSPNPTYQKESLARLINAFASTWAGRSYLTSSDYTIDILIQSLSTFRSQTESFICHMVIASLQKLSLRRNIRRTMIEQNVIPWLVKYIKIELDRDIIRTEVTQMTSDWRGETAPELSTGQNSVGGESVTACTHSSSSCNFYGETFNSYLMEYAWALLMNLCLHNESMKSALSVDFEFLHCIVTMLTNRASFEYTPYVLSTFFSLLRHPEMFEKARSMNLDKRLGPLIETQTGELATHLKHLVSQLYENENVDRLTASGETDYDDTDSPDPQELEPELELPESWLSTQPDSLVTGDDLLIREYIATKDIPQLQTPVEMTDISKSNNPNKSAPQNSVDSTKTGLPLRPVTPTRNCAKPPYKLYGNHEDSSNRANGSVAKNSRNLGSRNNNPHQGVLAKQSDGGNKNTSPIRNPLVHPDTTNPLLLHPSLPQQLPLTGRTDSSLSSSVFQQVSLVGFRNDISEGPPDGDVVSEESHLK